MQAHTLLKTVLAMWLHKLRGDANRAAQGLAALSMCGSAYEFLFNKYGPSSTLRRNTATADLSCRGLCSDPVAR